MSAPRPTPCGPPTTDGEEPSASEVAARTLLTRFRPGARRPGDDGRPHRNGRPRGDGGPHEVGGPADDDTSETPTTTAELEALNRELEAADARTALRFALATIPAGRLVVTTSFGPGGMVLLHQLRRMEVRLPVIFVDTLHHFPETLRFAREVARRWALDLRIYRPAISREAFEAVHGERLWERDLDAYHAASKVEPLERALVGVSGWISARRRDQSASREALPVLEGGSPLKINPLATWSRGDVWRYVHAHRIPYHPLHDQGYPSVGDEPLTTPVEPGEHERAGRWRGLGRTECGIHEIGKK